MSENYFYSSLSAQEIEDTLVGAVVYNSDQSLTTSQKAQARQNIGAGEVDTGLVIKGFFDTAAEMEAQYPIGSAGDAYGIGEQAPYEIYIWDAVHNQWVNNGVLSPGDSVIDDEDVALDTTWSSSKINTELSGKATPEDVAAIIDDTDTAAGTTWSSQKIDAEITAVTALHLSGTVTAFPFTISNAAITATMRVAECTLGTPSAVQSDVTWTTLTGSIELDGTLASGGSTTVDLILVETREVV